VVQSVQAEEPVKPTQPAHEESSSATHPSAASTARQTREQSVDQDKKPEGKSPRRDVQQSQDNHDGGNCVQINENNAPINMN
jgi:hypothetical protein